MEKVVIRWDCLHCDGCCDGTGGEGFGGIDR